MNIIRNKSKLLIILLFLSVSLVFTLYLTRQRQETRREASYFATTSLSLSSNKNSFNKDEEFLVSLNFNADGLVNSVHSYICFDKNLVDLAGTRVRDYLIQNEDDGFTFVEFSMVKNLAEKTCLNMAIASSFNDQDYWKTTGKVADIKFKALKDGKGVIEIVKIEEENLPMVAGKPTSGTDTLIRVNSITNFDYTIGQVTDGPKWSEWSECSKSCGGGTQTRKCINSKGEEVSGCGEDNSQSCNTHACGTSGVFYRLTPENASYNIGTQFSLILAVNTGQENMVGGDVNLKFDSSVLEMVSVDKLNKDERVFLYDDDIKFHIDNTLGGLTISLLGSKEKLLDGGIPANGNLFRINFKAKKEGMTNVSFNCVDGSQKESNILIGQGGDGIECNSNKNAVITIVSGFAQKWSRGNCDTSTGNYICTASSTGFYDSESLCIRDNNQRCDGGSPTGSPTPPVDPDPTGMGVRFNYTFIDTKVNDYTKCANWQIQVIATDNLGNQTVVMRPKTKIIGEKSLGKDFSGRDIKLISYQAAVSTEGLKGDKVSVFIKSPVHIMTKYGKDGQNSFYNERNGQITPYNLSDNPNKIVDFTAYPILAGDVNSDSVVDARDYSLVKKALGTTGDYDLDGNCLVNAIDITILQKSLSEKEDQLY